MFATIFCATNIIPNNHESIIVEGLNNTFAVPFTPTLFSFDITAVIAQMDREIGHNLKVYLKDNEANNALLVDMDIPAESNTKNISSTTFSTSFKNIAIFNPGEHEISVHIDNNRIGSSKLFFILDN